MSGAFLFPGAIMQALDPRLAEALQAQHTQERVNETVYQAMRQAFVFAGLEGFANWAHKQAGEERLHAAKFADYLTDKRGALAEYRPLPAAAVLPAAPMAAFQAGANLEAQNTELILSLYALADEVEDYDVQEFLLWFIKEQRDSESEFKNWIAQLALIAGDGCGLLFFDERLKD